MLKTVNTVIDESEENDCWTGTSTDLLRMVGGREESKRESTRDLAKLESIRKSVQEAEAKRAKANDEELWRQSIRQQKVRELTRQIEES
ncbi:hypothetical protein CXF83_21835 [Shewanella sp. Choline-02u-19]|jgi:hypothetical protein|uniref:hypothetical protein n=1 Tax=unclassified Shewanella TaxID=196818 RepID=UPI000C34F017|nr:MULTISPECIES: hypothetical protein [unclassified Shewanella]PKH59330.1 hypothetical protein CXF84_03525 [Shewanella sp. Bg11-22]PKI29159.1 hypothetical protein CXF83_21835 [Shewanella sp. Choline-02u-19]